MAYILQQIPHTLPRRLSIKISAQLAAMDYVYANSTRIAESVRKVLRFPADSLHIALDRSVKQLGLRRNEIVKVHDESCVALKYFGNLVRNSVQQRSTVEHIDLEVPPSGALVSELH